MYERGATVIVRKSVSIDVKRASDVREREEREGGRGGWGGGARREGSMREYKVVGGLVVPRWFHLQQCPPRETVSKSRDSIQM